MDTLNFCYKEFICLIIQESTIAYFFDNEDIKLDERHPRLDRFNQFKETYRQLTQEQKEQLRKDIEESPSYKNIREHKQKETPKNVVDEIFDMFILFCQLDLQFKNDFFDFIKTNRLNERCDYSEVKFTKFKQFKEKYNNLFEKNDIEQIVALHTKMKDYFGIQTDQPKEKKPKQIKPQLDEFPEPLDPYQTNLKITFREFYNGCSKRIVSRVNDSMKMHIITINPMDKQLIKKIETTTFVIRVVSKNWDIESEKFDTNNLVYYYKGNELQNNSVTLPSGKVINLTQISNETSLSGKYGPKGEQISIRFINDYPKEYNINKYLENQLQPKRSPNLPEQRKGSGLPQRNTVAHPPHSQPIQTSDKPVIRYGSPQPYHQPIHQKYPPFETYKGRKENSEHVFYYSLRQKETGIKANIFVRSSYSDFDNSFNYTSIIERELKGSIYLEFNLRWIKIYVNEDGVRKFMQTIHVTENEVDRITLSKQASYFQTKYWIPSQFGNIPLIIPIPKEDRSLFIFENNLRIDGKKGLIIIQMK